MWTLPRKCEAKTVANRFEGIAAKMYSEIALKIREYMTGKKERTTTPMRPESTLGLTIAVVPEQDLSEMTLESRATNHMQVNKGYAYKVYQLPNFENDEAK